MADCFNEAQEQAIRHGNGAMMVLAGPGSGKTTVITYRVRHLISQWKVAPERILIVTFTKAAAVEMRDRFWALMKGEPLRCTFGTFHSIFFSMLKMAYRYTAKQIISEDMQYRLLRELIHEHGLDYDDEDEFVQDVLAEISKAKTSLRPIEQYESGCCKKEEFQSLYADYVKQVQGMGMLDFDDMMVYCYELLTQRPDILAMWQNQYQYILVDEFQDINRMQYEIMKLLAGKNRNLFLVGDDDQSIYGFRGAKPEIMLSVKKDFPEMKIIQLTKNYRSAQTIVAKSVQLINCNEERYYKELESVSKNKGFVRIQGYQSQADEYEAVRKMILHYENEGIPLEEMAVLYRMNHQARGIACALMDYNIPIKMKGKIPSLFDHWAVKHVMAYMDLAFGNRERQLLLTVLNRPKRYISRDLLQHSIVDFAEIRQLARGKDWVQDAIKKLEFDLQQIQRMTPYAAVNYIRKAIGYDNYIREFAKERRLDENEFLRILDELQETTKRFQSFGSWFEWIDATRQQLQNQNRNRDSKEQAVTLSTMHGVKGLEYQVVFIIETNEDIIPYKKSVRPEELEEERRMFYVGMTRAKQYLHISYVEHLYNQDVSPSRFIDEIEDEVV